jgi:arylsulfatase A-like enzyme
VVLYSAAAFLPNIRCSNESSRPPNFIIIFCDDLGYADVGCFGSKLHRTPNLDHMAEEGKRLTSFYVNAAVCSPSRAALLTGCYHKRVGINKVLFPKSEIGLHRDEITIADLLKGSGYATACIGKWHLGDQPEFLPNRQGFDTYFGLPYSNDMWPAHDGTELGKQKHARRNYGPLPLLRNGKVIRTLKDQASLTGEYTEEAIHFIQSNKERPFFLYLAHTFPHLPLYAGDAFKGKSKNDLYGDAVEEIDWSTGQILHALRDLGIDDRTLVVFTSDNGPTPAAKGSAAPLRGKKGHTFEGGMREPCIVRWPGCVPAGTASDALTTSMDILPTFAKLAGVRLPDDRIIDGKDIGPILFSEGSVASPHEAFYYYQGEHLNAVRSGSWKLHVRAPKRMMRAAGLPDEKMPMLFNLDDDIGESCNVADDYPEIVKRLMVLVGSARRDLGDGEQNPGLNCRVPGRVDRPEYLVPY